MCCGCVDGCGRALCVGIMLRGRAACRPAEYFRLIYLQIFFFFFFFVEFLFKSDYMCLIKVPLGPLCG